MKGNINKNKTREQFDHFHLNSTIRKDTKRSIYSEKKPICVKASVSFLFFKEEQELIFRLS